MLKNNGHKRQERNKINIDELNTFTR